MQHFNHCVGSKFGGYCAYSNILDEESTDHILFFIDLKTLHNYVKMSLWELLQDWKGIFKSNWFTTPKATEGRRKKVAKRQQKISPIKQIPTKISFDELFNEELMSTEEESFPAPLVKLLPIFVRPDNDIKRILQFILEHFKNQIIFKLSGKYFALSKILQRTLMSFFIDQEIDHLKIMPKSSRSIKTVIKGLQTTANEVEIEDAVKKNILNIKVTQLKTGETKQFHLDN
ncbi:hypothetical protein CEXT_464921 [Caerostris extrusa]|uniref:Uncharacterized protein n=1 Tax=Caerostris extrusa TaxID=172846 RepID=A0AAV4XKB4_CAEEX|nr:hypothetical protein CEXT_464921 [Caerostris extrusa]